MLQHSHSWVLHGMNRWPLEISFSWLHAFLLSSEVQLLTFSIEQKPFFRYQIQWKTNTHQNIQSFHFLCNKSVFIFFIFNKLHKIFQSIFWVKSISVIDFNKHWDDHWSTWCMVRDWTWRFSTPILDVVTTVLISGTTVSLKISLMSLWLRRYLECAMCFTEKLSSPSVKENQF